MPKAHARARRSRQTQPQNAKSKRWFIHVRSREARPQQESVGEVVQSKWAGGGQLSTAVPNRMQNRRFTVV